MQQKPAAPANGTIMPVCRGFGQICLQFGVEPLSIARTRCLSQSDLCLIFRHDCLASLANMRFWDPSGRPKELLRRNMTHAFIGHDA
jgi:hypothetical protein